MTKRTYTVTETTVFSKVMDVEGEDDWDEYDYIQKMEEMIWKHPKEARVDLKDGWVCHDKETHTTFKKFK
jgi:hypothetical protein|tara:strand:+ start:37 stop:246 length:210 start_codon:yes stop_codon:yes gene_type:complete